MGQPIAITRTDYSAADLRAIAARNRDGAQVRRLLAIALVLAGVSRTEAAGRSGMDRQTLRDWVHRYNADGVEGLKSGHGSGHPPSLTADQMTELKDMVLKGPDPVKNGVVRWRCVDWTPEILDSYLTSPKTIVPGTIMTYAGLKNDAQRGDLIAYLATLH